MNKFTRRDIVSLAVSIVFHAVIILLLLTLPGQKSNSYENVEFEVIEKKKKPEIKENIEPEAAPEKTPDEKTFKKPKPEKKKIKLKKLPPPPPPPVEQIPEEKPEAPPVFDLSDDTFALKKGMGSWTLNRSPGNTKFAPMAKNPKKSVRNTLPKGFEGGVTGGQGDSPVAAKDLSRRPMPKFGSIKVPAYPHQARREGIEGQVLLRVLIDENGKVQKVTVLKHPDSRLLGETAKKAMLKEKWKPGYDKHGKRVSTVITYSYRFVLDD